MTLVTFLWGLATAVIFALCNIGTELSLKPNKTWLMYLVSAGAVFGYWVFRRVCQHHGLAISGGMVDSLLTVITISVAIFVLKEELLVKQYVGLGFLVVGLFLIRT